ncbi:MAG: polyamine aminopropyltransferase [Bacteriovoracaceae bacterium]|nr:polyamine aminopropyltransferase [Bacteriovoracaceae bacterium]
MEFILLFSVAVIATCGLVYELVAGALASYLLGDSITQFSLIIGIYLFSMGIGSYLSKYITRNVMMKFIQIEFLVGLVGGFSAAVLFVSFEYLNHFRILLYSFVTITGILVGLEIPLLMRILKDKYEFNDLVSKIFTVDYIGALFASILFPLVLAPYLGLVRTALLFGIINVLVGLLTLTVVKGHAPWKKAVRGTGIIIAVLQVITFAYSNKLTQFAETVNYRDQIVYSNKSPYQKVILTQGRDIRLFLNGNLQFSSEDEYRYHEALVHPGMALHKSPKDVLVLGGGDGLAVREILKFDKVENVTLVDLDPLVTKIFMKNETLIELNDSSLIDKRVKVINDDAFIWLRNTKKQFDVVIIDFPDPSNYSLGKLYTTRFFNLINKVMKEDSSAVIQSTSPLYARKSYWCVGKTLNHVGFKTNPFHVYVPSFGEWGFFLFSKNKMDMNFKQVDKARFLTKKVWDSMFVFPPDMDFLETKVNRLNNQILVRYFEDEWSRYN